MSSHVHELSNRNGSLLRGLVTVADLLFLNIYTWVFTEAVNSPLTRIKSFWLVICFAYLISIHFFPPVFHLRQSTNLSVTGRLIKTWTFFMVLSLSCVCFLHCTVLLNWYYWILYYGLFFILFSMGHLAGRRMLLAYRRRKGVKHEVLFVGQSSNLEDLYAAMRDDASYNYCLKGYFADAPKEDFLEGIPYLGGVSEVNAWLDGYPGRISAVYCSLPSARAEEIRQLIECCTYHVVLFYSVPNVRNYLKRKMNMALYGDVPVLYISEIPLNRPVNKFFKRVFDVVVSGMFLLCLFPWIYLIVGAIIKLTMPGPVFFRQRRTGLDGRDFWCYKFRSMKVNDEADSVQATKDDPRKTEFGNFMRHTNIDELPQFWNVFTGTMSIVGPRPHMLSHTKIYSQLISKYMVRHFVKPGITGWAQVTGCRGETHELWQMEERVKKDLWYIENWSFLLDLKIIWLTVWNVISEKNGEAY
ncbi:MAG: undecaprenyl-phosphate glucose phosphotransferase [Prevotella sp.]|jgi:putative colanic acid biosynthesis UDP-glucose lipid carrier transferase|nr:MULTISPECIES: undecaprenyl-phosphate glucose phosphotransferase [unclassified Prevotella]MCH3968999.1 undecaprenyl-phosphate glucose phosphotransferase [Prevotella sp.]MCH3985464.1 undecaprenyl-phosphate glucose phosphotransferase [Prevotella sp.]MCH4017264.1 undecaprenyl-phosphate glucose phosphotransferase [Prevotella sp.]MCH4099816.1 undecaprenyl-phosphate glucose phosphotransferase [Prevotella sp.]MCH4186892.1 undecaprenyl-phosphate glucose phosphotransferase [Prevotella sp.]